MKNIIGKKIRITETLRKTFMHHFSGTEKENLTVEMEIDENIFIVHPIDVEYFLEIEDKTNDNFTSFVKFIKIPMKD